jgi:tripartite-type tricarboxylate transporter receptor subunit TctC
MTRAIAWAAGALLAGGAAAQSVKPVTLLVPYPAGGLSDVIARMVEKPFAKASGQMAIVDNLGGRLGLDCRAEGAERAC